MATKIYDLSQLFWPGAAMWPRFVSEAQAGSGTFNGVRSTGWQGHLHCGPHVDAPIYAHTGRDNGGQDTTGESVWNRCSASAHLLI